MKNFTGFTLAEVLVTLGIVGVISAMTIPGLINTYRAHSFRSRLFKSYSTMKQVNRRILDDSSPSRYETHGYYKTFIKYLQGATDCGSGFYEVSLPCYYTRGENGAYKNLTGTTNMVNTWLDDGQIAMSDGTLLMFENVAISDTSPIYIFVDLNGYGKLPNRLGMDLFAFQLVGDDILPVGSTGTNFPNVDAACSKTGGSGTNGMSCTKKALSDPNYFRDIITNLK